MFILKCSSLPIFKDYPNVILQARYMYILRRFMLRATHRHAAARKHGQLKTANVPLNVFI